MSDTIRLTPPDYTGPVTFRPGLLLLPDEPNLAAALVGGATVYGFVSSWELGFGMSREDAAMGVKLGALSIVTADWLVGMVAPFWRDQVPSGWLLCDGAAYLRGEYPLLWDACPADRKSPDFFTVPDLRQRFVLGAEEPTIPVAEVGGEKEVQLLLSQMPKHDHAHRTQTAATIPVGVEGPPYLVHQGPFFNTRTLTEGNSAPHNNMPPYQALIYGVYTGRHDI